ncbi:DUF1543 domain-containing protein [Idiomarina tyrosinivorans]|uniref:DUF1543 domain-containing protein n=1 Tax=Idiomarina tyrosinivorans TaxID=1445662 RepID=A0A432ZQ54_9GAMM|nr:DUF1543 domain-containing protein [Idiomarina tyrosinivorans]RUO80039.1 DUF1543 domain-containing protein [Idiomarina tyrosinivorans]
MVYLGGTAQGANIELHDVRLVVGETIEDTIPQLKQQWFGLQKNLHIDSYVEVHHVDGYRIVLSEQPRQSQQHLYFVNLGGYQPQLMAEQHAFTLVVAESTEQAKQKAKQKLLPAQAFEQPHKDNLHAVDDCLAVDLLESYAVELHHDGIEQALVPDWFGYRVIAGR